MEKPDSVEHAAKVLKIAKFGDPVLRTKGRRVVQIDEEVRQLAVDMLETMYAARGLGLAAQQVGLPLQMTVIDVAQVDQTERPSAMLVNGQAVDLSEWMPIVLFNPRLETLGDEREVSNEGCLSFPEIHGDITRAARVRIQAQTLDRGEIEFEATGLLARALQHEVDHLQGILFIDRMSRAAKASLAGRLKRLQRESEEEQNR